MNLKTEEKAALALKHRLYVSGWQLSEELQYARDNPSSYDIKLEYFEGVPIAVGVLDKTDGNLNIFVRKSYRRKGIGTKLVKRFKGRVKRAGFGIYGSEVFFDKMNIDMRW